MNANMKMDTKMNKKKEDEEEFGCFNALDDGTM
jgi:hypothetical protein